jgi:hypothetical protein
VVPSDAISVSVNNLPDDYIRIGDLELPFTEVGGLLLGDYVKVPNKFLERLPADLFNLVLNTLLERKGEDVEVTVNDQQGLVDAYAPNAKRLDPRDVLSIAGTVVGADSTVLGWRRDNTGYGFEVVAPPEQFQGGDIEKGDISLGGLRFGQSTKSGLAPWVQPYIYRLVCTNGMEVPDVTVKIESRGQSAEDLLGSLELHANAAYDQVDQRIREFYDLRNEKVYRPEAELVRIGREQGLGDPTINDIISTFAQYQDEDGSATAFDVVNAITNQANDPTLGHRFNHIRKLQTVGGQLAFDHEARCPACKSKLGR